QKAVANTAKNTSKKVKTVKEKGIIEEVKEVKPEASVKPKKEKPLNQAQKEERVRLLLSELEGKSETTQRPAIDEIVGLGPSAVKPLADALNSGSTFQVRMASATALGELGHP